MSFNCKADTEGFVYDVSKVEDGNMDFRFSENNEVYRNREKFFGNIGGNVEDAVFMFPKFDNKIQVVGEADMGAGACELGSAVRVDALLTEIKGLPLALGTADCLPIIIYCSDVDVLGLVHCGLLNTDVYLIKKVFNKLIDEFEASPEEISVVIGPGAKKESFYYDERIKDKFTTDWGDFIEEKDGKFYIDNLGFNLKQLEDIGIREGKVLVYEENTIKNESFFSHFRDYHAGVSDQGRFLTVCYLR